MENVTSLHFAGNTRVITQTALQKFQEEMGKVVNDPYQARTRKIIIRLL